MTHLEVTWQGQIYTTKYSNLVIWGQIVIVISVNLFQIAPVRTGSLQLQPNLVHRCTMGTFSLWRSLRSHDKVKGHWKSNCYSYFSSRTSKKFTTMHKLYSMFMLEAWRWQICKTLAHYTSGNAKRAKRKFIRNASTSEEFGKIRQCFFYWRHEMHHSNGSRRLS